MKLPWRYVLVIALSLVASLMAAACGDGDGELDLEEYFGQLEGVFDATQRRSAALEEEFPGVEPDIEATRGAIDAAGDITRQTLDDLKDIHPPADLRDAHDEMVASVAAMLASWQNLSDRAADAESLSELETLLVEDDPAFDAAEKRAADACQQLQQMADDNGIDVDLGC